MAREVNTTTYSQRYSDWTLVLQREVPSCVAPPPACTLEITGHTETNVTLRGEADGQIEAGVSGTTGTTAWYIDGALETGSGATHTFTGLSAGYYTIRAEEGACFDQETDIQILDGEFRTNDFIVSSPTGLTVSENPIIVNLQTAFNTGAALPSKGNISVGGTVSDGDYLKFTLTYPQAYTAYFYAKEYPSRDNYFLASTLKNASGVNVGSNSATEIATSIAEVIEKDSVLNRLYWIRTDDEVVYLTAKENNTKLDISTVLTKSATNITITQTQNGNARYDGSISENYSLYCDVLVNETAEYGTSPTIDTFNKVAQLELPYNQRTNRHLFDIAPVLKNFVSTPKIDFTLTGYTTISNMMAGYKVTYGEKYPLIENSTTKKARKKGTTDTQFIYNGALAWEDENNIDDYLGSYVHNVKANFDGTITTSGTTYVSITINDYLYDTGATGTTGIKFFFEDDVTPINSGWQTSNSYSFDSSINYNGTIYISGTTDGIDFTYEKGWYASPSNTIGQIVEDSADPNIQGNVLFLTNAPNPKFIQRDSSEFLYIILPKDYGKTLKIKGDLYFYDGTSLTGETLYTVATGGTNYGGVFLFAAGYNELGLADYETYSGGTRKIRKLDFALYQSDTENGDYLLSEQRGYRFEIDEQSRRYGVAFLNKLGTFDIFDFAGEIVNSIEHTNERYEVPRDINTRGGSPRGFQANTVYNTKVVNTVEANSGWIDEDHFDWLQELLETNRCYNYTEDDQRFLIVKSVNYRKSSNDDLYNIDVLFEETIYQNNISV